jgi:hypothetical protein
VSESGKPSTKVGSYELGRSRRTFRAGQRSASGRAFETSFNSMVAKAGFELDKFEELRKQNAAEVREMLAKFEAEAAEQSSARQDAIKHSIENWIDCFELRKAAFPGLVVEVADTAKAITATDGLQPASFNIEPFNNSARCQININDLGVLADNIFEYDEAVTFTFSWQNSTGQIKNINVDGLLGITGTGRVLADGWVLPIIPTADLIVNAVIDIKGLWTDPPFQPPFQSSQFQNVMQLDAEGGFLDSEAQGQSVNQVYDLSHTMLSVPPGGIVEFDVKCPITLKLHVDSEASFDVENLGGQLTCYGVWIGILP